MTKQYNNSETSIVNPEKISNWVIITSSLPCNFSTKNDIQKSKKTDIVIEIILAVLRKLLISSKDS